MGANVRVAGGDRTYCSAALENSAQISTQKALVHDVVCYNGTGGDIWLQVHNAASVPADTTAVTTAPLKITNGDTRSLSWATGRPMVTGIYVCASSTANTKTLIAGSNCIFDVTYSEF